MFGRHGLVVPVRSVCRSMCDKAARSVCACILSAYSAFVSAETRARWHGRFGASALVAWLPQADDSRKHVRTRIRCMAERTWWRPTRASRTTCLRCTLARH